MTEAKVEKRLNYLTYYSGFITLLLLIFIVGAFTYSGSDQFEEIDVKRINIVESNGQPALVLANSEHLPGAIIDGDTLTNRKGIPGIIFYNSEGDESGGLIFDTKVTDSTRTAFGHLSFDRYKQDQVIALQYVESPSGIYTGLRIKDRPEMNLTKQMDLMKAAEQGDKNAKQKLQDLESQSSNRVFIGTRGRTSLLQLRDNLGNERIRISVDSTDTPHLQFLDKNGKVTYELPRNR